MHANVDRSEAIVHEKQGYEEVKHKMNETLSAFMEDGARQIEETMESVNEVKNKLYEGGKEVQEKM